MKVIALAAALLSGLAPLAATPARAESCAEAIAATAPVSLQPCLLGILAVEDPGDDPQQANFAGSGARGCLQIIPSTWTSTPYGDVPLAVASAARQIAAGVWLLLNLGPSPWAGTAPASCWSGS